MRYLFALFPLIIFTSFSKPETYAELMKNVQVTDYLKMRIYEHDHSEVADEITNYPFDNVLGVVVYIDKTKEIDHHIRLNLEFFDNIDSPTKVIFTIDGKDTEYNTFRSLQYKSAPFFHGGVVDQIREYHFKLILDIIQSEETISQVLVNDEKHLISIVSQEQKLAMKQMIRLYWFLGGWEFKDYQDKIKTM